MPSFREDLLKRSFRDLKGSSVSSYSLSADVLWGSFVTYSFLHHNGPNKFPCHSPVVFPRPKKNIPQKELWVTKSKRCLISSCQKPKVRIWIQPLHKDQEKMIRSKTKMKSVSHACLLSLGGSHIVWGHWVDRFAGSGHFWDPCFKSKFSFFGF